MEIFPSRAIQTQLRSSPLRLALPEGDDPRVREAAGRLVTEGWASHVTLWTSGTDTPKSPLAPDVRAGDITLIASPATHAARTRAQLIAMREARGRAVDLPTIRAQADDPLFQAGALLAEGRVDAVIAGAVCTTSQVIRAGLATVGLAAPGGLVSSFFLMSRPAATGGLEELMFADCGVVIEPNVEQLARIGEATATSWAALHPDGPDPKVAFLAFSTHGSAEHPGLERIRAARALFTDRCPDIACDGELQADAALIPDVAARKCPTSPLAGRANCLVFPDLNAGNIAYKLTERLGGYRAIGPNLQGFAAPYADLSRGCRADDIMQSALIAAALGRS